MIKDTHERVLDYLKPIVVTNHDTFQDVIYELIPLLDAKEYERAGRLLEITLEAVLEDLEDMIEDEDLPFNGRDYRE